MRVGVVVGLLHFVVSISFHNKIFQGASASQNSVAASKLDPVEPEVATIDKGVGAPKPVKPPKKRIRKTNPKPKVSDGWLSKLMAPFRWLLRLVGLAGKETTVVRDRADESDPDGGRKRRGPKTIAQKLEDYAESFSPKRDTVVLRRRSTTQSSSQPDSRRG
jgi:hypothetical protein